MKNINKTRLIKTIIISIILITVNYMLVNQVPGGGGKQKIGDFISLALQLIIVIYAIYVEEYETIKFKYNSIILGALVGLSLALLFIGTNALNPKNIDWIMEIRDRTQHFIGWNFYRNDSFRFPIGYFKNWAHPIGMSLIFTDSVPIAAIFFKCFRGILPNTFQYLGMWMYLSFIMTGVFAQIIFKNFIKDELSRVLTCFFLIATPIMFLRIQGHTSLTSQWLILWALYILISEKYNKKQFIQFIILLAISLTIHPYFLFINYIIFITYIFKGVFLDKTMDIKQAIGIITLSLILVLIIMYVLGYFKVNAAIEDTDDGFGLFSFNLNGLICPIGTSRFISDQLAFPGQYEGLSYLGVGGILLVFLAIVDTIRNGYEKNNRKLYITLIIMSLIFLILSFSYRITFYGNILYEFKLSPVIYKFWSIVRATGRMIWPVWYIIIIFSFKKIYKSNNNRAKYIIILIIVIQITDLSVMYAKERDKLVNPKNWQISLRDDFWNSTKGKYKHMAFTKKIGDEYANFAHIAIKNNLTMDYGYFARKPKELEECINKNRENLTNGNYDVDTIYIVNTPEVVQAIKKSSYSKFLKFIDNYYVFAPKEN